MMKKITLVVACLFALLLTVWGHYALERITAPPHAPVEAKRIVSLAPSITETLYALGLGERVVGVTQFCFYPPEVKSKPRVAGFSDINYEALLRVRPDLIVLPGDRNVAKAELQRLGLPVMLVDNLSLSGLMDSVEALGKTAGREKEAADIVAGMRKSIQEVRERAHGRHRPKVLFSVMHSYQGLGYISEVNAVGNDGFYNELIELAGGENIYQGELAFPRLSREAIIHLDPDVIIDVIPEGYDREGVRDDWRGIHGLTAVRNDRIFFFSDEATVPGPRFTQTLERLSQIFHQDHAS